MNIIVDQTDNTQDAGTPGPCAKCGKNPADGYASIWSQGAGEQWYCHGDEDDFTCYEGSQGVEPDAFGFAEYLLRPAGDA